MRRTRRPVRTPAFAAAVLVVATACATAAATSSRPSPVDTGRRALVYGHIDAPKRVQTVELAKVGSPRRPRGRVFDNGDFVFDDLAPGNYLVLRFLAGGEWYDLRSSSKESNLRFLVQTAPGGMHYAGSWRVTGEERHAFTPGHFSIERTDVPSRQSLLQRLRPALEGSGWERKAGGASGASNDEADAVSKAKNGG